MKENELLYESSSFRDNFRNVFNFDERIPRSVKKLSEHFKILKKYIISISGIIILEYETL